MAADIYQAVWLKPREAARYARVNERTLREWLQSGYIPYFKPSSRITLIRRKDLDQWIEQSQVSSDANAIVAELLEDIL